jgi:hypothetical protein
VRVDLDRAARAHGITLKPVLQTQAVPMLLAITRFADVIAIVPRIAATDALHDGTAIAVPLRDAVFAERRVGIFSAAGWPLTAAAEAFAHVVERQLRGGDD